MRRHLPETSIDCVHIQYAGCGDSSPIESITYTDGHGSAVDLSGKLAITEEHLLDLFYALIQARHPRWENNAAMS
jgi:hypothetical protein